MELFYRRRAFVSALALAVLLPESVLPQFTDQTKEAHIAFQHVAGGHEKKHIVETSGGGAAFFDYDNDGDLDLYAVNGATVNTYRQKSGPGNVLYRNQGNGTFADVTVLAGGGDRSWGMGCTVGDIDGDGYRDLYVTNYGLRSPGPTWSRRPILPQQWGQHLYRRHPSLGYLLGQPLLRVGCTARRLRQRW